MSGPAGRPLERVLKLRLWWVLVAFIECVAAVIAAARHLPLIAVELLAMAAWMLWPITLRED